MSALANFSEEETELIISLPYKVGIWVSYADDEAGEDDDALEQKELEKCIVAVTKLHEDKPFIKDVATAVLQAQDKWAAWADQAFHVINDVKRVSQMLEAQIPSEQAKNYKAMLMEIATTVAEASGEFSSFDDSEDEAGFSAFVGNIIGKFSGLSHDDTGHPMNISAAEDAVLAELAEALKGEED